MNINKLAAMIKEYRKMLGMTQNELADHLGVTGKAVSKWETGKNVPDISLLSSIISTLGIPKEIIFEDEKEQSEEYVSSMLIKYTDQEKSGMNIGQTFEEIQIDLNTKEELSPYIFGHNLEHTRACVYTGLSAQMLRNRKFVGKPSKNEGVPASWYPIGGTQAFFEQYYRGDMAPIYTKHQPIDYKMFRQNEIQSLGMQNLTGECFCGIGQGDIALSANVCYEIRTITQCDKAAELYVRLQDRNGEQIYAEKKLSLVPGDWQICEFTLTPDKDVPKADITFTFKDKTRVVLGVVSMLPAGHFYGMRKDVIEHMKEIGISLLRWPGGNFAGEYRWQDGLLPVDMRGPLQAHVEIETQPYSSGYDFHEIGTDEFIALCREIGAEPFITINAVWNSPDENAAWVEYCNGSAETKYGKIRAERGHKEPYNVKFWSLGNEMGYAHMEGPKTPEQYATLAKINARAMLAVDSELKLFSSGPYPSRSWVEHSAKPLENRAKYVSLHHYAEVLRKFTSQEDIEHTAEQIIGKPAEAYELIKTMREMLGDGLHISFDEWNCWYAWYRSSCVLDGIYAAKMMHMFMNKSKAFDMPICCYFQPVGEGAIEITPTESRLTAIGQVFAMLKEHRGGTLCPVDEKDTFGMTSTLKDDILTISIVNENIYENKTVHFNISGTVICAEALAADSILPHTYFSKKPLDVICTEDVLKVVLEPHSIALIRVKIADA